MRILAVLFVLASLGCDEKCDYRNECKKPESAVVSASVGCAVPDAGVKRCPDAGDGVIDPECALSPFPE